MEESWDGMEKPLRQLLGMVKKHLSRSERREVEDFIDCNECDAALEALVDTLVEKREPLAKPALDLARRIAAALDLAGELDRIDKNLSGTA